MCLPRPKARRTSTRRQQRSTIASRAQSNNGDATTGLFPRPARPDELAEARASSLGSDNGESSDDARKMCVVYHPEDGADA
jgi:hypothetical protein